ncbi:VWA domain-containing protein [Marinobacter caseinilyticus]|uniref:VWA domain-containing protein n=1 Tax=Marinobacter caseinilyticus TaxID=2692195 RepID=UPI00140CF6AD|nr:vWA domain-containing protein [Marinobacter caseinilyticus]
MRGLVQGVAVTFLCLLSGHGYAQTSKDIPPLPEDADIRVIVDISGSMKTNDPANLRQPAVRLIARLLPDGTRSGVWTFGEYVNMLVPFGEVDASWRELALTRSSQINSVALRTNLGKALEVASDDYFTRGDLSNTQFILLTDGKVDVSPSDRTNEIERRRVLGDTLRRLRDKGAKVHTVALSREADLDLLMTLAIETNGSQSIAESADELSRVFISALNAAVPQEQVPIESNGFEVDGGVEEFTALIFTGDVATAKTPSGVLALKTPGGSQMTATHKPENLRWVVEPGYNLITVEKPQPGRWQIEGTLGEGSRVTVVSDLRLVVEKLPARFYQGQAVSVNAAFYEDTLLVSDPDFLSVLNVNLMLTADDGRMGSKQLSAEQPPADGVYRDVIQRLSVPGDYRLELIADGTTFSRKFSRTITLRPPVQVVVDAEGSPSDTRYSVTVRPEHPDLDVEHSEVIMAVAFNNGETVATRLPFSVRDGEWAAVITPDQGNGTYRVGVAFQGRTTGGEALAYAPESFSAKFPREPGAQNTKVPLASAPEPEVSPQSQSLPATEPEPEMSSVDLDDTDESAAGIPEVGPIDISQVETPQASAPPASNPDTRPLEMTWLWPVVAGGTTLFVLVGGGLFWWCRRNASQLTEDLDTVPPHIKDVEEPSELGAEPSPLEPELVAVADADETAPLLNDGEAAGLSKEPEGAKGEEPDSGENVSEDEDFGMEDFDLSDLEALPETEENESGGDAHDEALGKGKE